MNQTTLRLPRAEFERTQLRLGPATLDAGRMLLRDAELTFDGVTIVAARAASLEMGAIALSVTVPLPGAPGAPDVKRSGPGAAPSGAALRLEPLDALSGSLHGQITDANLFFDATVTVRLQRGQLDFNDATVEHVGPDSRMGISRQGLYVDAPNGRSYLVQFATPPATGVEYERKGPMLAPWLTDRGRLSLRPFLEALLVQPGGRAAAGLTAQTRTLLNRTSIGGELRLGDGVLEAAGLHARLVGSTDGRNVLRVQSDVVGHGLTVAMDDLHAQSLRACVERYQLQAQSLTGKLRCALRVVDAGLSLEVSMSTLSLAGIELSVASAGDRDASPP